MRSLNMNDMILRVFGLAGLLATVTVSATAASQPLKVTNARLQVGPAPAPVPDPSASPGSSPPAPSPALSGNPTPGAPVSPVPPPEPGGAMYTAPFGTFREPPPPAKEYPGDPGGIGSNQTLPGSSPTTDRFGVMPPPGTLGHTYQRRSRLIDIKKHPRMGIVEVHLSENYDVSAKGLKSKWTGKVWQLESDPLLPGIPHIFEVVAEWGPEDAKQREVRTVRLIMGRIVDLDF